MFFFRLLGSVLDRSTVRAAASLVSARPTARLQARSRGQQQENK